MKVCKHFSECGGCRLQDTPYPEQLAGKEDKIRTLLGSLGLCAELKPINYSDQWYYRNKMEFSFGRDERVICGLYSKNRKGELVDLEECLIFSPVAAPILRAVKDFARRNEYPVYNRYSHQGFLRNVIVREAKFTQQLMVGMVTTSSREFKAEEFVEELRSLKLNSEVKSIYRIINDSWSDAVVFQRKELLWGEPLIEEQLGDFKFKIGMDTFFQVNPGMIAGFYDKLAGYANLSGQERVLDLFCGAGSIGIWLARKAKFVWGVEASKEVVDLAWQNAKINHIENISFFSADARRFLNTQGAFYRDIDLLVINPPRSGLSKRIIRSILRLSPRTIIYSSCNPTALAQDLGQLITGYNLDSIEPFDFFPHTPHLEVLCLLRRK